MSGVLSVAMGREPAQSRTPDVSGLLADRQLAAMFAVDALRDGNVFNWAGISTKSTEEDAQPDWFMGNSILVEQVLREVRTQLPEPNTPDACAELNALLSYSSISSMLTTRQDVPAVVQKICSRAQQIVDHAEEAAAQRMAAASSSGKTRKVLFTLDKRDGALGEADLTEDERRLIEARLRKLHAMQEDTLAQLEGFTYEQDAWKLQLGSDASRYVFIPRKSIRITDVVEVVQAGKRFFDITIKGLPMLEGGKLVFGEMQSQRFAADSDLVKANGHDAETLASALKKMDMDQVLAHIRAERERLHTTLDAAPVRTHSISGGTDVDADALCTLSPNAAAINLLPAIKRPNVGAALALQ